jgi:hypothetical protein
MADTKISALTSGAPALATDETIVARSGANYKLTVSDITSSLGSPVTVANGGTGQSSYTNGQLLIGNTTGNTLTKATLTAGSGISITNGSGSITIASTSSGGSVTSVDVSGGTTGLTTSGGPVTTNGTITLSGTLDVDNGGTGQTSYTDGQLLIGNSTGNTLSKSTLTAGSGISITNGSGTITIAATGGGGSGTVTSVGGTGTVNGITLTGTVTTSGNLTLGGTLSGVSLTSQVTGTLPIANGGTGSTSTAYCSLSSNVTGTLPIANGGTGSTSTTYCSLTSNVTGTLPVANGGTGITSFGTNVAAWLGTPSSANLAAAVTDETGSGSLVFATSPTLVTPVLGTPTSGNLNSCTADGTNKVGYRNIPAVGTKTGSYTLATGDVGKYVQIGTGGSITIPDATFAEGDVVSIFNNTTGAITITCTITTAYIAGTDTDKASVSLATRGVATILFISGTVCVISGNVS